MENNYAKLRIRMNRSFSAFGEEQRTEFLNDLAEVAGCRVEDFQNIKFSRGCVWAEIVLPAELARRLAEVFTRRNELSKSEDIESAELRAFAQKHCVIKLTDDMEIRVQVLRRLKPATNLKPKLLFVHGWRGDDASFGNLPNYMANRLGCETLIYDYPTGALSTSPEITHVWKNLDNWLRNSITQQPIAVFAHSMGGIIVRKMLVEQHKMSTPLDGLFKLVTLIASPNDGATIANVAQHIPFLKRNQLADIRYSDQFMLELKGDWQRWDSKHVPHDCYVRSIYGTEDNVVAPINATGLDDMAIPVLGADHTSIIKPKSQDDFIVKTLSRLVHEALPDMDLLGQRIPIGQ